MPVGSIAQEIKRGADLRVRIAGTHTLQQGIRHGERHRLLGRAAHLIHHHAGDQHAVAQARLPRTPAGGNESRIDPRGTEGTIRGNFILRRGFGGDHI